jgi:hypothetical protein
MHGWTELFHAEAQSTQRSQRKERNAAIRPRYGAGPGTAALAGLTAGLMMGVLPDIAWGLTLRLIPARVGVADAVWRLVAGVIATLLGARVYKEQAP